MRNFTSALEAALQKKTAPVPAAPGQGAANPVPQNSAAQQAEAPEGFYDVVEELKQLVLEGKIPADFNLEQACKDPAFSALVAEFPPEAAIRIYYAEMKAQAAEQSAMQHVNAQVRSRNALPRSARGGAMSAPTPNYRDMDDATFRKLLAEIKRSTRNGKTVTL